MGAGLAAEAVDLILHQGLKRRDDDGQGVAPQIAHQGRQQVAERFAAAGGQGGEQGAVAGRGFDNGRLQACSFCCRRLRPKIIEAEKLLQRAAGLWCRVQ
jgi:hypothetical protein